MTNDERRSFYSALDVVYDSGDRCSIEEFLTEQMVLYAHENGGVNDGYLSCVSELGSFYRATSRYEEALDMFRRSDAVIAPLFGSCSMEHAINLNNMAGVYRMTGEIDKSLELFLEALGICESLGERNNYVYASILNNIALLYQIKKEYPQALSCMRSAIKVLEDVPEARNQLATSYANLSLQLSALGEKEESLQLVEKAIGLFRDLNDRSEHYAAALNAKGVLSAEKEQYAEAKEAFLEALSIVKERLGENADYGTGCRNLARCLVKTKEYEEALRYMRDAATVFTTIFGESHNYTESAAQELREIEELLEKQ